MHSRLGFCILVLLCTSKETAGNPKSKPYIPFRTDPFDQHGLDHKIDLDHNDRPRSTVRKYDANHENNQQCPLQFSLGLSRRAHAGTNKKGMAIVQPPSMFPVHPSMGAGRQVVHATQYEHLDMLSPSQLMLSTVVKEGLEQQKDFPLLFESSSFLAAPLLHDFNSDGVMDALLVDYDGGMYFVGLHIQEGGQRFYKRYQIPRLQIRRQWIEARLNTTQDESPATDDATNYARNDPYHSYFEYGNNGQDSEQDGIIRGMSADMLGQDHESADALEKRRKRRVKHEKQLEVVTEETEKDAEGVDEHHRRLQQVDSVDGAHMDGVGGAQVEATGQESIQSDSETENAVRADTGEHKADDDDDDDDKEYGELDDDYRSGEGDGWADDDDDSPSEKKWTDDVVHGHDDAAIMDDIPPEDYGYYDDYYAMRYQDKDDYYDDKHYIRLPPHVLCSPILADLKKPYSSQENDREEMLFMAVSYYFDEDEYEGFFSYKRFKSEDKGDESEVARGMHVASALVAFVLEESSMRFGREEHLDLSSDPTSPVNATLVGQVPLLEADPKLGAFALSTPTVADIDGNGDEDIIIATSMGIVYCLHARHIYNSPGWPVQVKTAVESRILVEDVVGDTNLEVFVNDIGGNIYCFDAKGQLLWHRDLMNTVAPAGELRGSSSMTLGDVNGDGVMDLVMVIKVLSGDQWATQLIAISATTGDDLLGFPIEFDSLLLMDDGSATERLHQRLPQPLLVDLHADQEHWRSYLYRNGTKWHNDHKKDSTSTPPHGGSASGLHIIQPVGTNVYIVEGGSGCTQVFAVGEEIEAMVQADDVHGTNNLDLVVSTTAGNIITLESPAVPYHPLNVWNTGEVRSRRNNHAQGFTASQGIFVRDVSRRYRDIFGIFVPITFEIFDNRPSIQANPDARVYKVEIRDGTAARRVLMHRTYNEPGVYTERVYIKYGPGYYSLSVLLRTTHGIIYEDVFHLGYNVHYLDGISTLVWLPLLLAAIPIFFCSRKKAHWDDEEFDEDLRGRRQGILGNTDN